MQSEPNDGDLCVKCWHKLNDFHEFYSHIESVHEAINKSKNSVTFEPLKIELDEVDLKDEQFFDVEHNDEQWSFQNDEDASIHSDGEFKLQRFILVLFRKMLIE